MTADHVSIVWSTRENLTGVVQYSTDQSFSSSAAARVRAFPPSVTGIAIPFYQYQADLNGLSAGTSYSYRVVVDGQNLTPEPERRFRTVAAGYRRRDRRNGLSLRQSAAAPVFELKGVIAKQGWAAQSIRTVGESSTCNDISSATPDARRSLDNPMPATKATSGHSATGCVCNADFPKTETV